MTVTLTATPTATIQLTPGTAPRPVGPRLINALPTARPVQRHPEAVYRRRRALVGVCSAVIVALGAVVTHDVLAGSGGVPASAAASQPALVRSTTTAQPGDTLWSIAERHRGEVSIARYVDKLVSLNGGASIQAGQQVVLP